MTQGRRDPCEHQHRIRGRHRAQQVAADENPHQQDERRPLPEPRGGHADQRAAERDPERWIAVEWAEQPSRQFETRVKLLVKNGKGALAQIAQAISAAEADISHIEMDNEQQDDATELTLLLAVRDRQHLADVLRTVKRSPPVLRAARVKP